MKVDVTEKPEVLREATASGKIFLKKDTIELIKKKATKKGDVLQVAEVAAMNAIKQTQLLIPYCHQIPITHSEVSFAVNADHIEARTYVKTIAKTGVEMEAIVGVSMALNAIWDMVKYLEKDEGGQYPSTKITDIVVLSKKKGGI